ncbi:MAG: hypothetical protein KDD69_04755, partial [Bdellovibrionales bacterium]|nr:hypothetical protein [Bdellovibrionales bacterium]
MKRRLLALVTFLLIGTSSCVHTPIAVAPASEQEQIPHPKFVAKDLSQQNAWPSYSQIRVYRLVDTCEVPNCPLMWHVVVSGDRSPREIIYGGLPSFGAMTIVAPHDLQRGARYELRLDRAENTPVTGEGAVRFEVDDEGKITQIESLESQ